MLIQANNIVKPYSSHCSLEDVSITTRRGSAYGLLGSNGAGKRALIRMINHITAPDNGNPTSMAHTQQLQLPITMPLILSIIVHFTVLQYPGSSIAFWYSTIPLSLLYATFIGVTYMCARIYRTGIFIYRKEPTLREILRWTRYK